MPQLYKSKFRLIKDHLHPYCCRSVTQSCLFVTAARQGSLSLTISQSFLKINISLYSSVKLVVGVEQEIYFPVKDLTVKSIRIHCFLCVWFWFILSISFSGFVKKHSSYTLSYSFIQLSINIYLSLTAYQEKPWWNL